MTKGQKSHPSWVRGLKLHYWRVRYTVSPSHPSWVRGLKQLQRRQASAALPVAPLVGAWIETKTNNKQTRALGSHPSWVRGLKLHYWRVRYTVSPSHPSWVRGLKQLQRRQASAALPVAPLVGAWIETKTNNKQTRALGSHPSWVRGLKPR